MSRTFFICFTLLALSLSACRDKAGSSISKETADEINARLVKSFFATPLQHKAGMSGFWIADAGELSKFVEQTYLKDYKPRPNEPSTNAVRENLKRAHYFLRIDDKLCDEVFFVGGGEISLRVGELKVLERAGDRVAYSVVFGRRKHDGKLQTEGAVITANHATKELILEFTDRKFTFRRELREQSVLANLYGQTADKSDLPKY